MIAELFWEEGNADGTRLDVSAAAQSAAGLVGYDASTDDYYHDPDYSEGGLIYRGGFLPGRWLVNEIVSVRLGDGYMIVATVRITPDDDVAAKFERDEVAAGTESLPEPTRTRTRL